MHPIALREKSFLLLSWFCMIAVIGTLAAILGNILIQGISSINLTYLISTPSGSGRFGGIGPVIVSTAMIVAIALAVALPVGVGTALLLAEFSRRSSRFSSLIRTSLDILAGVPSIVFGLFGNAFFCIWLGLGFSILSGGLTLACMILPLLIRTSEEGFRLLPGEYRLGMSALGFSKTASVFHLLLPAAAPAIFTGMILGFGRAIAETAALIFTSGYVDRMPESPMDSGRALSVHIYDLAMNIPGGDQMAYGASLVLVLILVTVSVLSSVISRNVVQRGLKTI